MITWVERVSSKIEMAESSEEPLTRVMSSLVSGGGVRRGGCGSRPEGRGGGGGEPGLRAPLGRPAPGDQRQGADLEGDQRPFRHVGDGVPHHSPIDAVHRRGRSAPPPAQGNSFGTSFGVSTVPPNHLTCNLSSSPLFFISPSCSLTKASTCLSSRRNPYPHSPYIHSTPAPSCSAH